MRDGAYYTKRGILIRSLLPGLFLCFRLLISLSKVNINTNKKSLRTGVYPVI